MLRHFVPLYFTMLSKYCGYDGFYYGSVSTNRTQWVFEPNFDSDS